MGRGFESLKTHHLNRGVAQLGARVVWDDEVAGSIPVTPTTLNNILFENLIMRVSYIGNTLAFQASKVGSIPTTRSIQTLSL